MTNTASDSTVTAGQTTSKRYVVYQTSDNMIVNAIAWDGVSNYTPPSGCAVAQSDSDMIGQKYAE